MDPHRDLKEKKQSDQLVVPILGEEDEVEPTNTTRSSKHQLHIQIPPPKIAPTPSPSCQKPPRTPLCRASSRRKPKSRFEDQITGYIIKDSPTGPLSSRTATPRLPESNNGSDDDSDDDDDGDDEEDEDIFQTDHLKESSNRRRKINFLEVFEWLILVLSIVIVATSLSVHKLQGHVIWGLEIWRWGLMVVVVCCGRLVSQWFIQLLVFSIEKNFLLKKKVLYFVYGLKQSVQIFIWLLLILISWLFVFNRNVYRPQKTKTALFFVTRLLISMLIGSFLWLLKTLVVKLSASSFHMNKFFDRIQESIFHQYLLEMLSGPPVMEMAESIGTVSTTGQLSFRTKMKGKGMKEEKIDVWKLYKMRQEKVSNWTMKGLVNVIRTSGLSTISNTIHEISHRKQKEITCEWEARTAAYRVFKNVAKPGQKYIDGEDLMRFLTKEEAEYVLPIFEGAAETGRIRKSSLRNWVVRCYLDRKFLAHTLDDCNTAVKQLHKVATCIIIAVAIVIAAIVTDIASSKLLLFITSQLVLVAFVFGNSCKMVFEAIIFVFVMHPYDVGDRCVVDGNMMVVEEINILTTVFLKFDLEKVFYPNSVLATKPISNFYRSPDMWDTLAFSISMSTSMEKIGAMKVKIKTHIENTPHHWHPSHSVVVLGIEESNKMNMALYCYHTMNFQQIIEKNLRKTELFLALKRIFEELSIKYTLLPQEVGFRYTGSAPLPMAITKKTD